MTVTNWQALVIQKVDNAIHCISYYPADNVVGIHNTYPHWIVIYPVDCATEHLINRGQNCNVDVADKGQQHLSSLTVSSVFTRERSVQLLTQLCVKKPEKKNKKNKKNKPGR